MSSRQDRTAALMSSQRSWLPAQVREHLSMEEEGVHEFPFLTEEMWRTDGFWGKATQLFFKSMAPSRSTPYPGLHGKNKLDSMG